MSHPTLRRLRARDGLELAALDWPGPAGRTPILCLPGLTRSACDFADLAERQSRHRRVLALDHAGHGDSGWPRDLARYRIEESLRDVLDATAALHCPHAVVVGTSFGGILAMALAVLRPTVLAGLVLNDVGPALEPAGLDFVQNFVARDPALESLEACIAHLRATLPPLAFDEAGWRRFAAFTYAPGPDGLWHPRWDTRIARVIRGTEPMPDLWPAFGALAHLPLMLVRGEVSDLLSVETMRRMRRERPDMAYVSVPDVGHCPSLGEPEVVPALDAFLDSIP